MSKQRRMKPLWVDGFSCDPIHFQYQDAYHEQLLDRRLEALSPHSWGVLDLDVDLNALRTGIVRLRQFRAVLRGGVYVDIGDDGDSLEPRPLDEASARSERVDVFVTLAQLDDRLPNVDLIVQHDEARNAQEGAPGATMRLVPAGDAASRAIAPRYRTSVDQRVPDVSGNFTLDVPVVRHNLQLSFGAETRDRVDALKVIELVRTQSGALAPNPTFAPPLLRIGAARAIHDFIQHLYGRMLARQQALSLARRQRAAGNVESDAADAPRFWLLHTLNTYLPAIKELANAPDTHPAQVKEKLAELVGALCSFSPLVDPGKIPDYNHIEPGPILDWLVRAALVLVDQAMAERYIEIPLEQRRADLFVGKIVDATIIYHHFFLAISGGGYSPQRFWEHVPRQVKVSSENQVESLIRSASYGAALDVVHRPPAALPAKDGVAFFRVSTQGEDWNKIVSSGSIAIHTPIANTQVALYAVDPKTL